MNMVHLLLFFFLGIGIITTIIAFLLGLNNQKQRKIEEEILEKEYIAKYHRKPERTELED